MAIYAVMKTGGKQYRVAPGDIVMVEKLAIAPGAMVEISEVYLLASGILPLPMRASWPR
jgi:large subunit ribosomal protein L21